MNYLSTAAVISTAAVPTTTIMTNVTQSATNMFNNSYNGTRSNPPNILQMSLYCSNQLTNQQERIIKMTAYSVVLVVSLFGNILIAAVILGNKNMKKPTNFFILNMAISDLTIPILVVSRELLWLCTQSREWLVKGTVGNLLCKTVKFFRSVTIAVSILSLIFITIDSLQLFIQ